VAPGFTFNLVAALVHLRRPYDPRFALFVRTSSDGLTWAAWQPVSFDASDGTGVRVTPDNTCSEPIWVGAAQYLEYRVAAASKSAAAADLRFSFINTMGTGAAGAGTASAATTRSAATGGAAAADFAAGRIVVSAGSALPAVASPASFQATAGVAPQATVSRAVASSASTTPAPAPTEPPIVTRAEWGADESWCSGDPGVASLAMAFLHHTDTSNDYTEAQAPAIVRAIYYYHTKVLGWDDIGYNFLIDKYGTIYEGRAGSITANVIGAQVLGFNTHSLGVALIGDYMNVAPTAAQLASLEQLLAWKFAINGIDPLGTAVMTCETTQKFQAGQQVTLPTIAGHRDANYTDCPGTDAYALLPQIRTAVAAIEQPRLTAFKLSTTAFDPTGDGTQNAVTASGTWASAATWTVTVRNAAQATIATFAGSGTQFSVTWDGRDAAGNILPDGTYMVNVTATNLGLTAPLRSLPVAISTVPPQVSNVTAGVVSPLSGGLNSLTAIHYSVSVPCRVSISIAGASGAIIDRLQLATAVGAGAHSVTFSGKVVVGTVVKALADGLYRVVVVAADAAGHTARADGTLTVNSTVAWAGLSPGRFSVGRLPGTTLIAVHLERAAQVTITIRSVTGVLAWRDPLGLRPAGWVRVWWNGRLHNSGRLVTAGRYLVGMSASNDLGTITVVRSVTVSRL
jgi:flagellar hook assembly protein FlgD